MLGCAWRAAPTATVPRIPKNRLTANEIRVPMKVNSRTRTGIAYQRGERGVGGMLSGYHHPVLELNSLQKLLLDQEQERVKRQRAKAPAPHKPWCIRE